MARQREINKDNVRETRRILEDEMSDRLNEIIDFIFTESQQNIVKNNSFGVSGDLFGNVTVDKTKRLTKSITYNAPYADFVEYGTIPHNLPPHVLDEWCRMKFGLSAKDARRVAFLVARKIAREGIKEKPFLRPAMNKAIEKYGSL
ncbi:MAG: hypothetical protein WC350_05575 [Candidatus Micrarchaeia archaeon]|jgi:hypothetical protein